MNTDRLINALAADNSCRSASMVRAWSIAGTAAVTIAAVAFFVAIGPRPDFATAAETPRFLFKFVASLTLLLTATAAMWTLAHPGSRTRPSLALLLCAPTLLAVAVVAEMVTIPPEQFETRWLGSNALLCTTFIPLIGLGPLVASILALRYAAPTRPALAGAVAGLVAGGLAATFYAAHCIDDSPLFVATWYPLAVFVLAALGAIAGKTFLRW